MTRPVAVTKTKNTLGDPESPLASIDPVRLSKTMTFLLRHEPERGGLEPDDAGWVEVEALASGTSRLLRREVSASEIEQVATGGDVRRFEIDGSRIRALPRHRERRARPSMPDILYHATTEERAARTRHTGTLTVGRRGNVFLSTSEAEAWRVAHRQEGDGRPLVLYVDANRARRRGVRFQARRRGSLFVCRSIPARHILNLQPRFAEQLSAGGLPVLRGEDGLPRVALIRVTRRSGVTWEVAKGKLEPGEVPEETAVREVREEMGLTCELRVTREIGQIRYGFVAPGNLPRLKTVYLYLMEPLGDMDVFCPAEREGIDEVQWFTPDEAVDAVTHTSLIPLMHEARDLLMRDRPRGPG